MQRTKCAYVIVYIYIYIHICMYTYCRIKKHPTWMGPKVFTELDTSSWDVGTICLTNIRVSLMILGVDSGDLHLHSRTGRRSLGVPRWGVGAPTNGGPPPYRPSLLRNGCWMPSNITWHQWTAWWCNNHLEKYESQWEGLSHILWKIKNVPNHQPVKDFGLDHLHSVGHIKTAKSALLLRNGLHQSWRPSGS